ncbi:MAG: SxtJ family membrane protein, partial [Helicobacter sp.]|nr:SxtJ family membrane protein [Helicobacter sp.]
TPMKENIKDILLRQIPTKDLRIFLGILACVFACVGAYPLLSAQEIRIWSISIALLAVVLLVYTKPIEPVYRVWLIFGEAMGFCISGMILFVLFFCVFSPIGIAFRIFGRDCLNQKFDKSVQSYFLDREQDSMHSMKEQF